MRPRGTWALSFQVRNDAKPGALHTVDLDARWVDAARREARAHIAKIAAVGLEAFDASLHYAEPIE